MSKEASEIYRDLHELRNANIDPEHWILEIDNDEVVLRYVGPVPEHIEPDSDEAFDWQREQERVHRFRKHPDDILREALEMAGFTARHV